MELSNLARDGYSAMVGGRLEAYLINPDVIDDATAQRITIGGVTMTEAGFDTVAGDATVTLNSLFRTMGALYERNVTANQTDPLQADTYKQQSLATAVQLEYLLKRISKDQTVFTTEELQGVYAAGLDWAETFDPATLGVRGDIKNTGLTVWKDLFTNGTFQVTTNAGTAVNFFATNARIGTVPIPQVTADATLYARARRMERPVTSYSANETRRGAPLKTFADDPRQIVDAFRANELGGVFLAMTDGENPQISERPNMGARASYIMDRLEHDAIARLAAFCFNASKPTRTSFYALLENGLHVPLNCMISWPFIQIDTLAMLFAETGIETARCNYGFQDMVNPVDGTHRIHEWDYALWAGAKVTNPNNILLIPDVSFTGYRTGLSAKPVNPDFRVSRNMKAASADGVFYFDLPVTYTREHVSAEQKNPIPLAGKYDPAMFTGISRQRGDIFSSTVPPFPSWGAYNARYGFSEVNAGAVFDSSTYRRLKDSKYNPMLMFMRRTQTYNAIRGKFDFENGYLGSGYLDDIDPSETNFRSTLDGNVEFKDSKYGAFR
jgi:hypothetical protein